MRLPAIILICAVAVLAFADIKKKSVSLLSLIGLLAFSVIWNLVSNDMNIIMMVIGAIPAGLLFLIVRLGRLKIGTGDILLAAVLGVALGADTVCVTLLVASLICAVVSIMLLAAKKIKRDQTIPFIPFMGAGLAVSLFL